MAMATQWHWPWPEPQESLGLGKAIPQGFMCLGWSREGLEETTLSKTHSRGDALPPSSPARVLNLREVFSVIGPHRGQQRRIEASFSVSAIYHRAGRAGANKGVSVVS